MCSRSILAANAVSNKDRVSQKLWEVNKSKLEIKVN